MDRATFVSQIRRRPALKGISEEVAQDYINRGLLAVSSYSPLRVKLMKVPADRSDGVYSVPEDARKVTGVFVAGTNVPITFEVNRKPDGVRELWLYGIRLPSSIDLLQSADNLGYYNNVSGRGGVSRPVFGGLGEGFDFFDTEYSANHTFDGLMSDHHLALEIYCDYLGYESRTVERADRVDIVDRDPSGASTTLRRSQGSTAFQKLMDMRMGEFKREMQRPYWSRSSFGIIERLWLEEFTSDELFSLSG